MGFQRVNLLGVVEQFGNRKVEPGRKPGLHSQSDWVSVLSPVGQDYKTNDGTVVAVKQTVVVDIDKPGQVAVPFTLHFDMDIDQTLLLDIQVILA